MVGLKVRARACLDMQVCVLLNTLSMAWVVAQRPLLGFKAAGVQPHAHNTALTGSQC